VQPGVSAAQAPGGAAPQWHKTNAAAKAAAKRRFVTLLNALARGEGSEHAQSEAMYEEVCAWVAWLARWWWCSLLLLGYLETCVGHQRLPRGTAPFPRGPPFPARSTDAAMPHACSRQWRGCSCWRSGYASQL
jgi:hypothetical protein